MKAFPLFFPIRSVACLLFIVPFLASGVFLYFAAFSLETRLLLSAVWDTAKRHFPAGATVPREALHLWYWTVDAQLPVPPIRWEYVPKSTSAALLPMTPAAVFALSALIELVDCCLWLSSVLKGVGRNDCHLKHQSDLVCCGDFPGVS